MDLYRKRFKSAKEVVAKLRPIDDLLFSMIGKYHPEILEEFLKVILNNDSLKFISSRIQDRYPALPPYKSVAMDFTVRTTDGIFIDFEAQASHLDDIEKRCACMSVRMIPVIYSAVLIIRCFLMALRLF